MPNIRRQDLPPYLRRDQEKRRQLQAERKDKCQAIADYYHVSMQNAMFELGDDLVLIFQKVDLDQESKDRLAAHTLTLCLDRGSGRPFTFTGTNGVHGIIGESYLKKMDRLNLQLDRIQSAHDNAINERNIMQHAMELAADATVAHNAATFDERFSKSECDDLWTKKLEADELVLERRAEIRDSPNEKEKALRQAFLDQLHLISETKEKFQNKVAAFLAAPRTLIDPEAKGWDDLPTSAQRHMDYIGHERITKKIDAIMATNSNERIIVAENFSTKICSTCDTYNDPKHLKTYWCSNCKKSYDRDLNAVLNILKWILARNAKMCAPKV